MDVGALTLLLWTFTEREKLYDIFEHLTGARFTTSYTRIGGVANDIDDRTLQEIKDLAGQFPHELVEHRRPVLQRGSARAIASHRDTEAQLHPHRCSCAGPEMPTARPRR
jgi:NADH:ubiquinone oxidoreductase subunit D